MNREENVTRKWCIEIYFLLDRESINFSKKRKEIKNIEFRQQQKFCSQILMCRKGEIDSNIDNYIDAIKLSIFLYCKKGKESLQKVH